MFQSVGARFSCLAYFVWPRKTVLEMLNFSDQCGDVLTSSDEGHSG